jgi:hypothetical protein
MCQRAFGHVAAAFANTKKANVTWEKDGRAFYAASAIARRGFCPSCGTPLTFEYHDSPNIDLSVGSLDEPGRVRLASHFGVESRVASFHRPDGLPEKRTDEAEHVVKKWRAAYGEEAVMGPRNPVTKI